MSRDVCELVDLVDTQGQVIKQGVPRQEIDNYPDLHLQIIIAVILDSKGGVLVHQRALNKKVNPGDIDHVCGGVVSGETPEEAAYREAYEETGVKSHHLKVVAKGINGYNRYRYLLSGESEDEPILLNPEEVNWIRFVHPNELKEKSISGELTFVDEFFQDTDLGLNDYNSKL